MGKAIALKSKRMVTPHALVPDGIVVFEDGCIAAVGTQSTVMVPPSTEVVDCGNDIIAPGLMDIHCHGFVGGRAGERPGESAEHGAVYFARRYDIVSSDREHG